VIAQGLLLSDANSHWWVTPHFPEICSQSDPPPFEHNKFEHGYTMLVLLCPPNFHRHRGWLPLNQLRHRSVLQCSRQSFWVLFPENCPSLPQSSDSHLNVQSFYPAWMPQVHFPTRKEQHCRDSSVSLGTVLSETVATVSFSAPLPSRAVSNYCTPGQP